MSFVSYAQNFEDVMLWRALKHINNGFYIDVGANDPTELSVTRAFYEHGWHGINIEPVPYGYKKLFVERPRDVNLNLAVGKQSGIFPFYELSNKALSTFDKTLAQQHKINGLEVTEINIKTQTLNQVLEDHATGVEIHFMNIDVEGSEAEALQGLDLTRWRPWVILIESTLPTTSIPDFAEWESFLTSKLYEFVYFDGLNRFYVAKEHNDLAVHFKLPPNLFDQFVTAEQVADKAQINQLQKKIANTEDGYYKQAMESRQLHQKLVEIVSAIRSDNEAKDRVIQELRESHQNLIQEQIALRNQIVLKEQESYAKESVIQNFRSSPYFNFVHGPFRKLSFIYRFVTWPSSLRESWFKPHLGVLYQHPPISPSLPARYFRVDKLNKNAPAISIVTPSYNQGNFIERTIKSVVYQDYPKLEYIIQDGGSSDNTNAVIEKFRKRLKHFESRKDNGQAHAINMGFAHAAGEIMAYLNSDDALLPNTLVYVANYFAEHPEVDVVYGHRLIVDEDDKVIGDWIMPPHDGETLKWADYIPQETMFWRRGIWDKAGGQMDESFQFALDWDLLLRFQDAGAKFKRLPRYLSAFRVHGSQKTTAQIADLGERDFARLRLRALGREVDYQEIYKRIRMFLIRSVWHTNWHKLKIRTDRFLAKLHKENEPVEWYIPESKYFISVHKAGTSLFTHVLRQADELIHVDYETMIFDNQLDKAITFHKYGYIYGVARIRESEDAETFMAFLKYFFDKDFLRDKKCIFLIRDPRDIIISWYYSMGGSHILGENTVANERILFTRKRLQNKSIDDAALYGTEIFKLRFEFLYEMLQTCQSGVVLKYEDLINNFEDFMKEFNKYISIPEDRIQELYIASRPREDEDVSAHKRSGKIGQYKEKLRPETIEQMNRILKPVLEKFNYPVD